MKHNKRKYKLAKERKHAEIDSLDLTKFVLKKERSTIEVEEQKIDNKL